MSATHKSSFEEFLKLPDEPGKCYELSQGELVMTPSPTLRHNLVRDRVARRLKEFVYEHRLGVITIENDFRLDPETVRNPDIAFITAAQLETLDFDKSPIEGAPALAVEVVSPGNSAMDMLQKVHQYLDAGCHRVWVVYPNLDLATVHGSQGPYEVTGTLREETLFEGIEFTLALPDIFAKNILKI